MCLQVVGPIAPGVLTIEEYQILQEYELAKRVQPVLSALEDIVPTFGGYDRWVPILSFEILVLSFLRRRRINRMIKLE